MKWQLIFLLLMEIKWRLVSSTCVFESDFGFTLNCGFKKSSMFRVRNLGGVKSYFGLGFSLGDELGFRESLSNLESANRRSVPSTRSAAGYFLPLMNATSSTSSAKTTSVSSTSSLPQSAAARTENKRSDRSSHTTNLRTNLGRHTISASRGNGGIPPFRPIAPSGYDLNKINRLNRYNKLRDMEQQVVGVPAFAALPNSIAKLPSSLNPVNRRISYHALLGQRYGEPTNIPSLISPLRVVPQSLTVLSPARTPSAAVDPLLPEAVGHALKNVAEATNISADALLASIQLRQQQMLFQQQKQLAALAAVASTMSAIGAATNSPTIVPPVAAVPTGIVRPEPAPQADASQPIPSYVLPNEGGGNKGGDDSDTTPKSSSQKYALSGAHKVMNAPKEYYPVNYDKNFDDNFTSRVELPETSFTCGSQKHFPGLYADEDLNCMVFHVCALTDDGLTMKSFLCPESTLFDQSVLKCNWWFYVDCKISKKLYDSNIPISKSYQLMKALTFFSSYNKNDKQSPVTTATVPL